MEKVCFAFHSITVKVPKGLFCYSFFLFFFWSCRLIQGSRRFSRCVSGFWVGVSCSGAPYIHRCIGVLRKLLGLGMGFLRTCEEMVCTDFYSITVWLLKGFFCFSFFFASLFFSSSMIFFFLLAKLDFSKDFFFIFFNQLSYFFTPMTLLGLLPLI